jgi:hypothetical protein
MVKPKNFNECYKGRFLKAGLLDGKHVTVTIADIFLEDLEGEKGIEEKCILTMEGKKMQLVLCKLNALCIKAMFGSSISAWIGKRIILWPTDTIAPMKKGEACIRIWGSQDIEKEITIPIALPRRKAFNVTLRKSLPTGTPPPATTTQPELEL